MEHKRFFDIFLGVIALLLLLFPCIIISFLVLITSKGPILHWSKRKGINNIDFMMPKFRSMIFEAPIASSEGINQKKYLTPIGNFIRKYSLDEFPQLLSILKGDMSFVGPRPALWSQHNLILFRKEFGVNNVLPGVTGLAQISGRNEMTVENKVYYDSEYIKNQSIWLDIKIIFLTLIKSNSNTKKNQKNFSSWPSYTEEEAIAVREVISSSKLNDGIGMNNINFEKDFSSIYSVKYASTVSSGSSALELALRAIGLEAHDEIIVSPRSFVVSASAAVNIGSIPIFADVDIDSGNISAKTISKCISKNTKALICVHLAGNPCEMDEILRIAKKHNLFVIEDCAQAIGATYKGKSVGTFGDIGVWSFCNDKILSTGEGGMVATNNEDLFKKMVAYKNHGRDRSPPNISNSFQWVCHDFGTNLRMTEMQAAIGIIQLRKINARVKVRALYASIIYRAFEEHPEVFRMPKIFEHSKNAWYRIIIYIRPEGIKNGFSLVDIIDYLNSNKITVNSGSCPEIYLEDCFQKSSFSVNERLPNAKTLGETAFSISINSNLPIEIINQFAGSVNTLGSKIKNGA
jgi:dTDP-4-amino-4,6-dideoxygalactose transaminase/lipopolysaccharide/colanic/teichoic acid biosynthesis glycosyltransferase